MSESERTRAYREISRDSYADILEEKGGIENTPTEDLLKVHQWLTNKPCITRGEQAQATKVAKHHFNQRRKHLLEELDLLNDALEIQEALPQPQQPQQASGDGKSLEQKIAQPNLNTPQSSNDAAGLQQGLMYLDPKEAKQRLFHFFQDPIITNAMFGLLMQNCIPLSLMERFNRLTEGYALINLTHIGGKLRIHEPQELFRIISSFPGDEIRELVKELNPAERYHKQIYVVRKDVSFQELCSGLAAIQTSLHQLNFAYSDILEILKSKDLHPASSYFNIVVQTLFERLPEGTFESASVQKFREASNGYQFVQLRTLVNRDYSKIPALIEALKSYHGPLTIRYPVKEELIQSPDDPEYLFLFKEPIDIEVLGKEIRCELTKLEPWITRVKRRT